MCFLFVLKKEAFSTSLVLNDYFWRLYSQATKLGVAFISFLTIIWHLVPEYSILELDVVFLGWGSEGRGMY